MNQSNLAVAMHMSSIAMINAALDGPAVTEISIIPADREPFVHFSAGDVPALRTHSDRRREITVAVAGFVAERLYAPDDMTTSFGDSMDRARQFAQQWADISKPNWRNEAPSLDRDILVECMVSATLLIQENRALIDTLSAELAQKGELDAERVQQIFAA